MYRLVVTHVSTVITRAPDSSCAACAAVQHQQTVLTNEFRSAGYFIGKFGFNEPANQPDQPQRSVNIRGSVQPLLRLSYHADLTPERLNKSKTKMSKRVCYCLTNKLRPCVVRKS